MNKLEKENFARGLKVLIEELPKKSVMEIIDIMSKLKRYETTLNNKYTIACNRNLTEKEEITIYKLEIKIKDYIAVKIGCNVKFNQDPRGYSIKIYLPSKKYNSLDGESWRVNW